MKVHVSNPPLVDGWLDQMTSQELGVNEFDSVYPIKMLSKWPEVEYEARCITSFEELSAPVVSRDQRTK